MEINNQESPILQQPLAPIEPPQIVSPSNTTQWFKMLSIGFALVSVFVSIAIGGYLLSAKKAPQKLSISPTIAIVSQTPTLTPDPTANWNVYVDSQKRYQVSYPYDWDYVIISGTLNIGTKTMITQIKGELAKGYPEVNVPSGITITDNSDFIDTATNQYQKTIT